VNNFTKENETCIYYAIAPYYIDLQLIIKHLGIEVFFKYLKMSL